VPFLSHPVYSFVNRNYIPKFTFILRVISTSTIIDGHAFERFSIIEMLFAPYDRAMLLDARSLCGS